MPLSVTTTDTLESPATIARAFVSARQGARALAGYPGRLPVDMAAGYAVQDEALSLWPERPAGWKVGRIPDEASVRLGDSRLAGPIFQAQISMAAGQTVAVPVIVGGFAAVEAEFIYRIGRDADPAVTQYDRDTALALVDELHFGVEMAGSPLSEINDLGSPVVASDFGNNYGLIVGGPVPDWRARTDAALVGETRIDGATVGSGNASGVLGGPAGALAWLAGHLARRGRPLTAGQWVTTGAVTGIHRIGPDQTAEVRFPGLGTVLLSTVAATAAT